MRRLRWRFENDLETGRWYWTTFDGASNNIVEVSDARFNTLLACVLDAETHGCETGAPTGAAGRRPPGTPP
jgi:hypothetical protein